MQVAGYIFDASQITKDIVLRALALYGLWLIRGSIVRRGGADSGGFAFSDPTSDVAIPEQAGAS